MGNEPQIVHSTTTVCESMTKHGKAIGKHIESIENKGAFLHKCSCLIGFIKRVREYRSNARLVEFNKIFKTGSRLLESIYHMTLKIFCNRVFLPFILTRHCHWRPSITFPKSVNHLVVH